MNVRELARLLEEWPANEATVVISDGGGSLSWVFATTILERRIARRADNPELVGPGSDLAIEISNRRAASLNNCSRRIFGLEGRAPQRVVVRRHCLIQHWAWDFGGSKVGSSE